LNNLLQTKATSTEAQRPRALTCLFQCCAVVFPVLLLVGCTSPPPSDIRNICAIFKEKPQWRRAAQKTERRWGIPTTINMAFIYQESSFVHNARPPRKKWLGFIPRFKRQSSSVGYAQVIRATWSRYQDATGNSRANRKNFADSLDFVGWYNLENHKKTGIPRNDSYHLYLAYHEGAGGYKEGQWKKNKKLKKVSSNVQKVSEDYARQITRCNQRGRRKLS